MKILGGNERATANFTPQSVSTDDQPLQATLSEKMKLFPANEKGLEVDREVRRKKS